MLPKLVLCKQLSRHVFYLGQNVGRLTSSSVHNDCLTGASSQYCLNRSDTDDHDKCNIEPFILAMLCNEALFLSHWDPSLTLTPLIPR